MGCWLGDGRVQGASLVLLLVKNETLLVVKQYRRSGMAIADLLEA